MEREDRETQEPSSEPSTGSSPSNTTAQSEPLSSGGFSPAVRTLLIWLGAFGLCWLVFGQLFLGFPVLYDTDSYYHLGIGKVYADHGVIDALPWARFSALFDGFGDKEVLFHLLLAPFAAGEFPEIGGRWALAFLNALVVVVMAFVGHRLAGPWGLTAPIWVYLGSFDFLGRLIRLRPETPALLLFIAAALCVGARRYRLLGVVAFLFTLSYTAFHALLGLCGLWFLQAGWMRRNWRPEMVMYPVLGALLALWIHPHFPHNLVIWKIQSLDFFQYKAVLDVGNEIGASPTDEVLRYNLPWLAALGALWLAGGRGGPMFAHFKPARASSLATAKRQETADALVLAACVFGVLYLLMLRFSTHFLPLATLAIFAVIGRPNAWMPLPGRGKVPLALVMAVILGAGGWRASHHLAGLSTDLPQGTREGEWAAFGKAVPPGAKVAAWWGNAHTYLFWAPQGAYLNVLDPVFMAVPFPEVYAAQRRVFDGEEPDIPRVLVEELDSDFLAASRFHRQPEMLERLRHDPRIRAVYQAHTLLFQVVPYRNEAFVTDWRQVPKGEALPVQSGIDTSSWVSYPLNPDPKIFGLEAYIDARRISEDRCAALSHDFEVSETELKQWELAPFGPTTLWLDDQLLVSSQATMGAFLGRGLKLAVEVEPGSHRLTAFTCTGEIIGAGPPPDKGFYLIDRAASPQDLPASQGPRPSTP